LPCSCSRRCRLSRGHRVVVVAVITSLSFQSSWSRSSHRRGGMSCFEVCGEVSDGVVGWGISCTYPLSSRSQSSWSRWSHRRRCGGTSCFEVCGELVMTAGWGISCAYPLSSRSRWPHRRRHGSISCFEVLVMRWRAEAFHVLTPRVPYPGLLVSYFLGVS
jgi:hypothetical protein